jgi:hypothetical protein
MPAQFVRCQCHQAFLEINAHDNPPRKIAGAQLLFVPVTPRQGWVSWDAPHRYAVMYPCSGVLAQADPPVPEALGMLLGPVLYYRTVAGETLLEAQQDG